MKKAIIYCLSVILLTFGVCLASNVPYPPKLNGDASDAKKLDLYLNQITKEFDSGKSITINYLKSAGTSGTLIFRDGLLISG